VAVVYAVMVETGYNRTELGKIILAACFINDIGTVLALGLIFANYNLYLLVFVISTIVVVVALPWVVPWVFSRIGGRASEPEIKFLFLVLFGLGGLATLGKSEAVLPAYLVGMALAPFFMRQRELQLRIRAICFAFLTPWYFLKAGSLIDARALIAGAGFIALFLSMKMATKFVGILPLTRYFKFERREGMYTTLMMSTGLTFGSISALFGLTKSHHRSGSVYDPAHRRHRQRRRTHADRTNLVSATLRTVGGRCLARVGLRTHQTAGRGRHANSERRRAAADFLWRKRSLWPETSL
jgi:Kef-type K+ transport system membrane component KefB